MARTQKYTAEQVADALRRTNGLRSIAAHSLGCTPQTVRNYVLRYKMVQEAEKEAREIICDVLESEWIHLIRDRNAYGHWDAVKFGLQTVAKERGFVKRTEVTGADGAPVEVKHTVVSDKTRNAVAEMIAYRQQQALTDANSAN